MWNTSWQLGGARLPVFGPRFPSEVADLINGSVFHAGRLRKGTMPSKGPSLQGLLALERRGPTARPFRTTEGSACSEQVHAMHDRGLAVLGPRSGNLIKGRAGRGQIGAEQMELHRSGQRHRTKPSTL